MNFPSRRYEVSFKCAVDIYQYDKELEIGDFVAVQSGKGYNVGVVTKILAPTDVISHRETKWQQILNKLIDDRQSIEEMLSAKITFENDALARCRHYCSTHRIGNFIRPIAAEFQFDRKKLTIYVMKAGDASVCKLVRKLFDSFKIRISILDIESPELARHYASKYLKFARINLPIATVFIDPSIIPYVPPTQQLGKSKATSLHQSLSQVSAETFNRRQGEYEYDPYTTATSTASSSPTPYNLPIPIASMLPPSLMQPLPSQHQQQHQLASLSSLPLAPTLPPSPPPLPSAASQYATTAAAAVTASAYGERDTRYDPKKIHERPYPAEYGYVVGQPRMNASGHQQRAAPTTVASAMAGAGAGAIAAGYYPSSSSSPFSTSSPTVEDDYFRKDVPNRLNRDGNYQHHLHQQHQTISSDDYYPDRDVPSANYHHHHPHHTLAEHQELMNYYRGNEKYSQYREYPSHFSPEEDLYEKYYYREKTDPPSFHSALPRITKKLSPREIEQYLSVRQPTDDGYPTPSPTESFDYLPPQHKNYESERYDQTFGYSRGINVGKGKYHPAPAAPATMPLSLPYSTSSMNRSQVAYPIEGEEYLNYSSGSDRFCENDDFYTTHHQYLLSTTAVAATTTTTTSSMATTGKHEMHYNSLSTPAQQLQQQQYQNQYQYPRDEMTLESQTFRHITSATTVSTSTAAAVTTATTTANINNVNVNNHNNDNDFGNKAAAVDGEESLTDSSDTTSRYEKISTGATTSSATPSSTTSFTSSF